MLVKELQVNIHNEVTGVTVLKGKTREKVKRHISSIILLLRKDEIPRIEEKTPSSDDKKFEENPTKQPREKRKAALNSRKKIMKMAEEDLI